jgi:hypothetical protein
MNLCAVEYDLWCLYLGPLCFAWTLSTHIEDVDGVHIAALQLEDTPHHTVMALLDLAVEVAYDRCGLGIGFDAHPLLRHSLSNDSNRGTPYSPPFVNVCSYARR